MQRKHSLTGLNSEVSFSYNSIYTQVKEHHLSDYLPIDGVRIAKIMP